VDAVLTKCQTAKGRHNIEVFVNEGDFFGYALCKPRAKYRSEVSGHCAQYLAGNSQDVQCVSPGDFDQSVPCIDKDICACVDQSRWRWRTRRRTRRSRHVRGVCGVCDFATCTVSFSLLGRETVLVQCWSLLKEGGVFGRRECGSPLNALRFCGSRLRSVHLNAAEKKGNPLQYCRCSRSC
jgi:hypothetical protein